MKNKIIILTGCCLIFLVCNPSETFAKTIKQNPKIGLVLGGGGARGGAHIGALYAAGVTPSELEEMARSGVIKKVYKTRVPVEKVFLMPVLKAANKFLRKPYYAGLYGDYRLRNYINNIVESKTGSTDLKIPFGAVTVDLISGERYLFDSGDVGLAVQASTAIPGLRKPIKHGDKLLVDGGVIDNISVESIKQFSPDVIIVVNIDPAKEICNCSQFSTYEKVLMRAFNLGLIAQSEKELESADVVITPELSQVGILDFGKEKLSLAISSGEEAAKEALPKIRMIVDKKSQKIKTANNR